MTISRLYARLIRRLGHRRWFSLLVKHALSKLDRTLIRASRGRFSLSGREMATMLLTTKGRRSGKERTTPVYYVRDGPNLVAACENFGLGAASEWPKNLLADAYARIQIGATASEYCARLATDAEIARSMPRLVEMWPAHDTYLERTGTRYVFVFQPVGASA
jgi:deazaflavin-dependent oxidoreductase (nitroreductase family)